MKLTRRLATHARLQGGALYVYDILLDGVVVGTSTVRLNKKTKPWSQSTTYAIGDETFLGLAAFTAAIAARKGTPDA